MTENKKPEMKYRAGGVTATIWKNVSETKDGKTFENYSVTLSRSYVDKDKNWKETNSYSVSDIAKAKLVLSKAFEFIAIKNDSDDKQGTL